MMRLYDRLHELPVPLFVGQRMKLPCINFKLHDTALRKSIQVGLARRETAPVLRTKRGRTDRRCGASFTGLGVIGTFY